MQDLTVILLTANKVPKKWADFHLEMLKNATQVAKWITMSKDPVDYGLNDHSVSSEGLENIYRKMLVGAKLADTEYVAYAEDDTVYPREHFEYRPQLYGYNMTRWMAFTWGKPFYFYKPMHTNATLIAKRQFVIDVLEDRFKRRPKLTPSYCKEIGALKHEPKPEEFYTKYPIVGLSHKYGIDELEQKQNKKAWPIQAYDIPGWRNVRNIINKFV